MATIKINELGAGTPVSTDLVPFADPTTGLAEKATITQIATLIQPLLTGKADLNGDSTETFEVADATSSAEAVNKGQLDVAINALQGALIPQGNWDASTNTPDITGTTATGYYWIVSVDGSTSLDGITDWKVNDWAVKTATGWAKIDNSLPTTLAYTNVDNNFSAAQTFQQNITAQFGVFSITSSFANALRVGSTQNDEGGIYLGNDFETMLYKENSGTSAQIQFRMQGDQTDPIWYLDVNGNTVQDGSSTATSFIGDGSQVTDLNATEITSGTLADARLSTNVALKDQDNNFSVEQTAPNFNGKFDNITLQDLSLSQSLLESWARTREVAGDTYFPNEGAYSLALDKSLGIKPVIDLIPSAINTNVIRVYNKDTSKDLTSSRTSTATYVDQFGEIETAATGVPRIDYTNGVGELLLEPQSTNEITYSEDFTDASWTKPNITINANSSLSPDGSVNADSIVDDATNSFHRLQQSFTVVSGTTYSQSVYVKKGINRYFYLGTNNFSFWDFTFFDLENLVAVSTPTGVDTSIESLSNGWIRVSATKQANTSGSFNFCFGTSDNNTTTIYTGTGVSVVDVWGAQLEELSYPTSYIPTSGTTATRIADAVTGATGLGSVIGSSEGVMYADVNFGQQYTSSRYVGISDGTTSNRVIIGNSLSSNTITTFVSGGGSTQAQLNLGSQDLSSRFKIALKYSVNDFALWVNGVEVDTDVLGTSPIGLNSLRLDEGGGANVFYGRIREVKVYDTALTDAELQTLTTL